MLVFRGGRSCNFGTCAILLVRNPLYFAICAAFGAVQNWCWCLVPPKKNTVLMDTFPNIYMVIYIYIHIYIYTLICIYGIHICRYLQDEIFFDFHMCISKKYKYIYIYLHIYYINYVYTIKVYIDSKFKSYTKAKLTIDHWRAKGWVFSIGKTEALFLKMMMFPFPVWFSRRVLWYISMVLQYSISCFLETIHTPKISTLQPCTKGVVS